MLVIRLKRVGKKHQPSYRLVVSERRSKLGGPPVEDLGSYSPFTKKPSFTKERVLHWMSLGAKPTVTVHNLLVKEGIVTGAKIKFSMKKAEPKPEVPKSEVSEILKDEVPIEEKPAETVAVAEAPAEPASSNA